MKFVLRLLVSVLFFCSTCLFAGAMEGGRFGDTAPEFPPGEFSDGGHYRVSDFRGKLLVLFFYEQRCPTCRRTIPHRNAIVKRYANEPVTFIAIGAGDSLEEVQNYIRETHLNMPVFADRRSAMEKAYGFHISLGNIYQIRLIAPDGTIIGYDMEPKSIDEALQRLRKGETNWAADAQPFLSDEENAAMTARSQCIKLNNEAIEAMNAGDHSTAIDKLKSAIKKDPDYRLARENLKIAYTNYGFALENQGKSAEAEKLLKEALQLSKELYTARDANYEDAVTNYAGVLSRMGKNAEARQMLETLRTAN